MNRIYLYIFVMALVSYVIRVLPLTLIRKPITNRYVKSFLFYLPYVTLTVMTFPAIIDATGNTYFGVAALIIGIILAILTQNLFIVASGCCLAVLILSYLL